VVRVEYKTTEWGKSYFNGSQGTIESEYIKGGCIEVCWDIGSKVTEWCDETGHSRWYPVSVHRLVSLEEKEDQYDPTQMGDKDDDI
jgi:hypothetical protein